MDRDAGLSAVSVSPAGWNPGALNPSAQLVRLDDKDVISDHCQENSEGSVLVETPIVPPVTGKIPVDLCCTLR